VTAPATRAFVFQCSSNTYSECIEHSLFGSNTPWPLQVRRGDYCLLHHYEYDTLLALWRAESDGGKRLIARAWSGKFPFQVRVVLVTPSIIELPKGTVGSDERSLEGSRAEQVLQVVRGLAEIRQT